MKVNKICIWVVVWSSSSALLLGQSQRPTNTGLSQHSSGVTWAMQAMLALNGGNPVNSVSMSGTVTWNTGSGQGTGNVTLQSSANTNSQVQVSTSAGNRTETRSWASDGSGPIGQWTDLNGQPHQMAQHNCWNDAVWFFPALSMLSDYSDPNMVYNDLGQEQHDGHNVEHIQAYRTYPGLPSDVAAQIAQATAVNYYLDSQTALPVAMTFSVHDDHNINNNVLTEIIFSQYQPVNGIQAPFQVTRILNGTPMFQIAVTNVVPNG